MNANVVTALAALLGSVAGASAAIATTWISQRSQTRRDLAKSEMRKRETLYGEFITEAARLLSDAFDHTLDKPEKLVQLYATPNRPWCEITRQSLFRCRILDVYATPNRTVEELIGAIRSDEMAFLRK